MHPKVLFVLERLGTPYPLGTRIKFTKEWGECIPGDKGTIVEGYHGAYKYAVLPDKQLENKHYCNSTEIRPIRQRKK